MGTSEDPAVQSPIEGLLDLLREAVEGGVPGEATSFLDGTARDGSGNHGLLATLAALSAEQASRDVGGTSVAGQARHTALHLEVLVRWDRGERGRILEQFSRRRCTSFHHKWAPGRRCNGCGWIDVGGVAKGEESWLRSSSEM